MAFLHRIKVMHRASIVWLRRFTAHAPRTPVLAGLSTCLLLVGCAGWPDAMAPGLQQRESIMLMGPDNTDPWPPIRVTPDSGANFEF